MRYLGVIVLPVVVLHLVALPVGLLLGAPESKPALAVAVVAGWLAGLAAGLWALREMKKAPRA